MAVKIKSKTEIKIRMLERGLTQEGIGKTLGVGRLAVHRVFAGHDKTPRIRKAISEALGWPESRIWAPDVPKEASADRVA